MNLFYDGAKRIERFLFQPKVEHFIDAATMWFLAILLVCFTVAAVAFVVAMLS